MTQSSIQAYENAKRAGQTESTNAQNVINNGDTTDQQIAAEKTKVEEKYNSLKQAIAGLTQTWHHYKLQKLSCKMILISQRVRLV